MIGLQETDTNKRLTAQLTKAGLHQSFCKQDRFAKDS